MAFPSTLSTFNRPTASDRLNSPSHSALHNTVSSALGQVEAVIGVDGASSVVGTMMYDLRSPASNGGGHVQVANKGGTGQTTFTKGDILVASSSSVLAKLAVGSDTQILQANSLLAAGVGWTNFTLPNATKLGASGSIITLTQNSAETSIMTATVAGSVIGTNNAVRGVVWINNLQNNSTNTLTVKGIYGTSSVAVVLTGGGASPILKGKAEWHLQGANATNSQQANLVVTAFTPVSVVAGSSMAGLNMFASGTFSEDSGASKATGITIKWSDTSDSTITTGGYVVEKIY